MKEFGLNAKLFFLYKCKVDNKALDFEIANSTNT